MKLSQFNFNLPPERIASEPTRWRDECKLMVLHKDSGKIEHRIFKDILEYFEKGDTFVRLARLSRSGGECQMFRERMIYVNYSDISEEDRKHIGLEIHSGQNRVVRRIFEKVGYKVVNLDRVSFAGLTKKKVGRGKWRFLTPKEVAFLQMGQF